jgi:asparagine synthase (glutamine-hydrolysing)
MCGIIGVVSKENLTGEAIINQGLSLLKHRGPDDQGFFKEENQDLGVYLGHTRFSIIDLSSAGHQPMVNEDGSIWLICNGEIYNYQELRKKLKQKGHRFRSDSDSEVLLHLYEEKGPKVLDELRGMFAFCLWDRRKKILLAARDPLGIKPLYYHWNGSTLVLASEAKTIFLSGLVKNKIDEKAIIPYLKFGSLPCPRTIYEGIKCLEPGHSLIWQNNVLTKEQYWSLSHAFKKEKLDVNESQALDIVRNELKDCLEKHLIADVPLGVFLSGGIDSSAIVSLAAKLLDRELNTLSVVFPDTRYDESKFAQKVGERYRTKHQEIRILDKELVGLVENFLAAMDQPTIDGLNTYLVSLSAKRAGLKVCLSGLGGDELFGGYPSFRRLPNIYVFFKTLGWSRKAFQVLRIVGNSKLDRLLDGLDPFSLKNLYLNYRAIFSNKEISLLLGKDVSKFDFTGYLRQDVLEVEGVREKISVLELSSYLANQLLRDSDVFSMVHPVEIRVPFVDQKLIERLARIPAKYKYQTKPNKAFLIKVAGDLPREIYQRPKKGFTLPLELWMRNELKALVETTLGSSHGLNQSFVRKIMNGFYANRIHWSKPWSLFILNQWLK